MSSPEHACYMHKISYRVVTEYVSVHSDTVGNILNVKDYNFLCQAHMCP